MTQMDNGATQMKPFGRPRVKPNVYLAGPWADRPRVKEIRQQMIDAGINVTSRWITTHGGEDETTRSDDQMALEAMHDVEDVMRSEIVVVWNSIKSEGKAVETGLALAANKGIIIIGDKRTNVFQYLRMPFVATVEEAIELCHNYPWRPGQEPDPANYWEPEDPALDIVLAEK